MFERSEATSPPARGAERNRSAAVDDDGAGGTLPSLSPGITLLEVEGDRATPVVQSLVLDHLLRSEGSAFWIDADGRATTTSLARLAPSRRLLDRIRAARGFTAFQHYAALRDLPAVLEERESDPSLLVAPALDSRYRNEEALADGHARTLQARALARLAAFAREGVPVLVTRTAADAFAAPIETVADRTLECQQTRMGPRFVGEGVETRVYPVGDGAYYQTTFAYWRQYLRARAERVGVELEPASPPAPTATRAGAGGW